MQLSPAHQCMNERSLEVDYAHSDSSSETREKERNETCCCFAQRLKSCCRLFCPVQDVAVWKRRNKRSLGLGFVSAGAKISICVWMSDSRSYIPAELIGMRDLETCAPFALLNKNSGHSIAQSLSFSQNKGETILFSPLMCSLGLDLPPTTGVNHVAVSLSLTETEEPPESQWAQLRSEFLLGVSSLSSG